MCINKRVVFLQHKSNCSYSSGLNIHLILLFFNNLGVCLLSRVKNTIILHS